VLFGQREFAPVAGNGLHVEILPFRRRWFA
jgi:hypothetical protein